MVRMPRTPGPEVDGEIDAAKDVRNRRNLGRFRPNPQLRDLTSFIASEFRTGNEQNMAAAPLPEIFPILDVSIFQRGAGSIPHFRSACRPCPLPLRTKAAWRKWTL